MSDDQQHLPAAWGTGSAPLAPQQGAAWAPPPKPGLIPLRPMTLGTVLSASFQVLRRNPRPTFGTALLLQGGATILSVVLFALIGYFALDRAISAQDEADAQAIGAGAVVTIALAALIPLALTLVSSALLQGIVVLEVASGTVGERLRFAGLWRRARPRLWAVIGWTALVALAVVVAIGVLAAVVTALIALGGAVGLGIGIALAVIGALGLIVLAVWLVTKLGFVPSALVIERLHLRAAVARSWSLTRGYFWRTLGITLLVAVIVGVAGQIVTAPVAILFQLLAGVLAPTGDLQTLVVTLGLSYLALVIVSVVVSAITSVVQSACGALLYLDLRMRKEGLDLELARFVEARQLGEQAPDPYTTAPRADGWSRPTSAPWQPDPGWAAPRIGGPQAGSPQVGGPQPGAPHPPTAAPGTGSTPWG